MNKTDLEYILQTLNYGLNECDDNLEDKSTHFNSFANSICVVEEKISELENQKEQRKMKRI